MKLRLKVLIGFLIALPMLVGAVTVNVVGGLHKPPYIIQSDDGVSGFEVEFVERVLEQIGHRSKFVLVPFARSMKMMNEPNVDAVMTASTRTFSDLSKLSAPYVTYQNVAVSLSENNLNIQSVDDLSNHTVASFQTATKVLGPQFAAAVDKSPYYFEISTQQRQIELLLQGKVDVLVLDVHIFKYFNRFANLKVNIHPIFPKSEYRLAVKDPALISKFDNQAKKFKSTRQYSQLLKKYHMTD
ncbi:MAG: transporter substrate-binding domain-containing protein [Gammaproteobacteria bacterium]|nr:transporter substrate-binding domain-containing protein [Gammaproteobacteria bacterium]